MKQSLWDIELAMAAQFAKVSATRHTVYIYADDLEAQGIKNPPKGKVIRITTEWIDISETQGG